MRTIFDNKCLASWAVFKRFGENGHKNRYDVLREFIKATIYKHSLKSFTISGLTDMVNDDYAFNLKAAVIAYAIQKLRLEVDGYGNFICDPDDYINQRAVIDEIERERIDSTKVLELLFDYVENKRGQQLIPLEKEELVQSFINYILDNSYSDKYAPEISSFVITYKEGNPISVPLESILEGVVSYTGVTFDTPASASSRWTTEMYVYLDTEIIFHMAGYNGSLYMQLFEDFYSFVEEINKDCANNGGGKRIHLRYFQETEDEINIFFDRAKDIVNNRIRIIPYVTAMKEITIGCNSDSDIDEKRGLLEGLIKKHGIIKDINPVDYYNESQFALNLEDQKIVDDYLRENKKLKAKDVLNSIISLSHINVLRKGKSNKSFENLRYVLLTDNFITKRLSRNPEIRKEGDRPLSTDLYFITNRMWYRLGKAFGNCDTPKVFDVICKAKIILASQINNSVSIKYDELVQRMDKGEISPEDAVEVLYQLRSEVRNPEDLENKEVVEDAWAAFTETEISKYAEKRDFQEQHQKKIQEENERLRAEIDQMKERNIATKKENEEIKLKMTEVAEENKRIEKVNLDLSIQADETNKRVKELSETLVESQEREKSMIAMFYKRELNAYINKRKGQAWWNLILFSMFIFVAVLIDWLTDKYHWQFMTRWLQRIFTFILPQIIYICRAYVTKINPVRMIKIICGKDKDILAKEFGEKWGDLKLD